MTKISNITTTAIRLMCVYLLFLISLLTNHLLYFMPFWVQFLLFKKHLLMILLARVYQR